MSLQWFFSTFCVSGDRMGRPYKWYCWDFGGRKMFRAYMVFAPARFYNFYFWLNPKVTKDQEPIKGDSCCAKPRSLLPLHAMTAGSPHCRFSRSSLLFSSVILLFLLSASPRSQFRSARRYHCRWVRSAFLVAFGCGL